MLDGQEYPKPEASSGGLPGQGPAARSGPPRIARTGTGPGTRAATRTRTRPREETETETRKAARQHLEDWLDLRYGDPLAEQHRWALLPPGKLLRPVLLLESAAAVGGSTEQVEPVATGFELMHAGSLIHDDIIDGDELRRGRAAIHRRFGADRAIVGADALFFAVFETLGECRRRGVPDRLITEATAVIAEAGLEITRGATMELDLSGTLHDDIDTYMEVARLKTAALLRAACRTGAVLAGATAEQTAALTEFGEALGIAFQIQDDLLPYAPLPRGTGGDDGVAGKSRTSDLRNGRPVLPHLLAHRHGSDADRALLAELLDGGTDEELRQDRLHRLLDKTGALRAAQQAADSHLDRCRRALKVLPPSPHRHRLAELADQYTSRARPVTVAHASASTRTGEARAGVPAKEKPAGDGPVPEAPRETPVGEKKGAVTALRRLPGHVWREIFISYRFNSNDLWSTVVPASCFVVAAVRSAGLGAYAAALTVAGAVLYFWLFIYGSSLINQITGVEEDRLNKPFRPLVTGDSTMRGAKRRLAAVHVLFPAVGLLLGVVEWALLWQLLFMLHYAWGGHRHWFAKNLLIALGVVSQLASAWEMVTPITTAAWHWIFTMAAMTFLIIGVQDLRDVEGDRTLDRRTMPIVLGDLPCRIYFAVSFVALLPVTHFVMVAPAGFHWWTAAIDAALAGLSLLLAARVLLLRTPAQDHRTQRFVEWWYTFVLGTAVVLL
ncbi:UbiA family prenyltransferase [Streptomyces bathyalis]|uniref:UbiA family prenyltransferase n=1 Tax=Streptomyces bathyalis TaxID=2710756 RepID=A0A7T1T8F1_9ACTN|nr:polyprenyl synthetase family protein [Streptomyces bathyalis]QPP08287.1 UbiA family prenyltransferase [Streptomyces bathyalis]